MLSNAWDEQEILSEFSQKMRHGSQTVVRHQRQDPFFFIIIKDKHAFSRLFVTKQSASPCTFFSAYSASEKKKGGRETINQIPLSSLWCSTGPGGQCPLPYINLLMDSPHFSLAAALPPTGQQRSLGVISPQIGPNDKISNNEDKVWERQALS